MNEAVFDYLMRHWPAASATIKGRVMTQDEYRQRPKLYRMFRPTTGQALLIHRDWPARFTPARRRRAAV